LPRPAWKFTRSPGVADVQFSATNIWKALHPRGRSTYRYLTDVEIPDALTAIFRFERPSPYANRGPTSID
jgi:peptide/nickel transport system substrate-binding protein